MKRKNSYSLDVFLRWIKAMPDKTKRMFFDRQAGGRVILHDMLGQAQFRKI